MDQTSKADYQPKNRGCPLVAYVDFREGNSGMQVIQHIAYDQHRDILLARYMDTMATKPPTRGC